MRRVNGKPVFASLVAGALVAIGSMLAWLTLSQETSSSSASRQSPEGFDTTAITSLNSAERTPASPVSLAPPQDENSVSEPELTPTSANAPNDEPSVAGELSFAHGSLEDRVWILRRALQELEGLGNSDRAVEKLGYEMLPTAVGGILDAQGRGIDQPQGKHKWPVANENQRVILSQSKYFVFERFEFPEYETFLAALDAGTDWTVLGDRGDWISLARTRVDDALVLMQANLPP